MLNWLWWPMPAIPVLQQLNRGSGFEALFQKPPDLGFGFRHPRASEPMQCGDSVSLLIPKLSSSLWQQHSYSVPQFPGVT